MTVSEPATRSRIHKLGDYKRLLPNDHTDCRFYNDLIRVIHNTKTGCKETCVPCHPEYDKLPHKTDSERR